MNTIFRPLTPEDAPRISEFLLRIFKRGSDDAFANPEHQAWKYWTARGVMDVPRSYVLEQDGEIVAHGAVWPSRLLTETGSVTCGHVIDWAADPSIRGSGSDVMRRIADSFDVLFAFGGTEAARRVLPGFGYKPYQPVVAFAKPLHPWRIQEEQKDIPHPMIRLARNVWWNISPPLRPSPSWTSRIADPYDELAFASPAPGVGVFERSMKFVRYCEQSPLTTAALYIAERDSKAVGYFLLIFAPGQARIADAWMPSEDPEDWRQLYTQAALCAQQDEDANEVMTVATLPAAQEGIRLCGFRAVREGPFVVYDPHAKFPQGLRLHFQMVDNDDFFRHPGVPQHET